MSENYFKDKTRVTKLSLISILRLLSKILDIPFESSSEMIGLEDRTLGTSAKNTNGILGKKEIINDVDIAIDCFSMEEIKKKLVSQFGEKCLGKPMAGLGTLSTKIPLIGNGRAQVDFMFGNLELLKFMYHSPDYSLSSGIKRNILMKSIVQEKRGQVFEDKKLVAVFGPSLLLNKGIVMQYRHFPIRANFRGRLKKMKSITKDEFNGFYPGHVNITGKVIDKPKDIMNFIFQEFNVTEQDFDSYESIWKVVQRYDKEKQTRINELYIKQI